MESIKAIQAILDDQNEIENRIVSKDYNGRPECWGNIAEDYCLYLKRTKRNNRKNQLQMFCDLIETKYGIDWFSTATNIRTNIARLRRMLKSLDKLYRDGNFKYSRTIRSPLEKVEKKAIKILKYIRLHPLYEVNINVMRAVFHLCLRHEGLLLEHGHLLETSFESYANRCIDRNNLMRKHYSTTKKRMTHLFDIAKFDSISLPNNIAASSLIHKNYSFLERDVYAQMKDRLEPAFVLPKRPKQRRVEVIIGIIPVCSIVRQ